MTLDEILSRPQSRRYAIVLLLITAFAIGCARYFVLPHLEASFEFKSPPFLLKLLEDLSTSLTITIVLSLAIHWLKPKSADSAKIMVLDASEIRGEFKEALSSSDSWRFYGGCGRYFRSAVLSAMNKRATAESSEKTLHAVILNPGNAELCEEHASYRSSTNQGRLDGNWTASRVKCELLATIVLCLRTAQSNALLRLHISVSDRFSVFRADISDSVAIETREDPKAAALKIPLGSDFYKAFRTEFQMTEKQSFLIVDSQKLCKLVRDEQTLMRAITALAIPGVHVTAQENRDILSLINRPVNPHG